MKGSRLLVGFLMIGFSKSEQDLDNLFRTLEKPKAKIADILGPSLAFLKPSTTASPMVKAMMAHLGHPDENEVTGCADGFIENADFFDEHVDPSRPCYAHVCYPLSSYPYYKWDERFLVDKCCKHEEHDIIFGEEILLEDDQCSSSVVKCGAPEHGASPLIPIIDKKISTCCTFEGKVIYPGHSIKDFESCGIVNCTSDAEISHEIIFPKGCCKLDDKMIPDGDLYTDDNGESYLCYKKVAVTINLPDVFAPPEAKLEKNSLNDALTFVDQDVGFKLPALLAQDSGLASLLKPQKPVKAMLDNLLKRKKPILSDCLESSSLLDCMGPYRKKRSVEVDQELLEILENVEL